MTTCWQPWLMFFMRALQQQNADLPPRSSEKKGFWCDMAVVARYRTACRDCWVSERFRIEKCLRCLRRIEFFHS